MVSLTTQVELRAVQTLPFCYLCGVRFAPGDDIDRDHVPPKSIFAMTDRQPLILRTHRGCNNMHKLTDEKIGQLIALNYGQVPANPLNRRLRFAHLGLVGTTAVTNLNIDAAIWRWIAGFHAALYREPLLIMGKNRSLITPFRHVDWTKGYYSLAPLRQQHSLFVKLVKVNRLRNSVERIVANKAKMTYECLWIQDDERTKWMCVFALKLYDWADMGSSLFWPKRGCAGVYAPESGLLPANATRGSPPSVWVPDANPLDPFA